MIFEQRAQYSFFVCKCKWSTELEKVKKQKGLGFQTSEVRFQLV
jgi:hypothetical protein